jgi:hypothetical protein
MSEPTENQKRAERIAKQNARAQTRLENRRITLERRIEAEAIVEETSGNKLRTLAIYNCQLEMALAKQKRIQEQLEKDIEELEEKFQEFEDELEDDREAQHKKIDERFDKKLSDMKKSYEERVKRLKDRLEANETRPQVENMKAIIENTKSLSSFKKKSVADVSRQIEKKDLDEALDLVPQIRQNEVIQSQKKEDEKIQLERMGGYWECRGCQNMRKPTWIFTTELPTLIRDGVCYCGECAKLIG